MMITATTMTNPVAMTMYRHGRRSRAVVTNFPRYIFAKCFLTLTINPITIELMMTIRLKDPRWAPMIDRGRNRAPMMDRGRYSAPMMDRGRNSARSLKFQNYLVFSRLLFSYRYGWTAFVRYYRSTSCCLALFCWCLYTIFSHSKIFVLSSFFFSLFLF